MFKVGSLFTGIGGIDLAFQNAGFEIAWQIEIDDYCQKALAKNFPNVPKYRDIYDCDNFPYVDVITAGFPCQPFSVAGLRKGADDERFLIPRMLEVVAYVNPKMVFLENVPGFASLNDGTEFKLLLRSLAEMGYDAQWGHIRASDVGAPHKRERWFCVAYSDQKRRGEVGGDSESLREWSSSTSPTLPDTERNGWQPRGFYQPRLIWRIRDGRIVSQIRNNRDTLGDESHSVCIDGKREELGVIQFSRQIRRHRRETNQTRYRKGLPARSSEGNGQQITVESRLGRAAHGLSYRLDGHQFPSSRNVPQYGFEPSRVTDRKQHRRDRIKALGNAVVPQVILPIAQEMYSYLMELEA
jgi:DNA (cytosine-5)-methyltransferase 1